MFGNLIFGDAPFGDAPPAPVFVVVDTRTWTRCPRPGASVGAAMRVDENSYTDGYTERRVRGINKTRHTWQLSFPFVGGEEFRAMDDFLRANMLDGFWFTPPTGGPAIVVTCDQWNSTVETRQASGAMIGTLSATFVRSFTPQGN